LQDANEIDCFDDVPVFGPLNGSQLPFIAPLSQLINVRLDIRLSAQIDDGPRHLGGQAFRDGV